MKPAYTAQEIRAAEQPLLAAGEPLMAKAAFAASTIIRTRIQAQYRRLSGTRITVLVGPGNNGGDALFTAAHLARFPTHITVITVSENVHAEGIAALRNTQARLINLNEDTFAEAVQHCTQADLLIDGILGIGAHDAARGIAGDLISELNRHTHKPWTISLDIPSGIDASTGEVSNETRTIRADDTITFGALKIGLCAPPALHHAGRIHIADIGLNLPQAYMRVIEPEDFTPTGALTSLVSAPPAHSHKYLRGVTGIIAGSAEYPGAGIIATQAAVASGPGMVRYLGEGSIARMIVAAAPEIVTAQGQVQSYLVGSGLPPGLDLRDLVFTLVREQVPVILDAGALATLDPELCTHLRSHHILTPHAGELAELLTRCGHPRSRTDVEAQFMESAVLAHTITGATIVAKSAATIIVGRHGAYMYSDGTSQLASAGAGDALAGILATSVAKWFAHKRTSITDTDWALVAAGGVYMHGFAARLAAGEYQPGQNHAPSGYSAPITATRVIEEIPRACALLNSGLP
ncbi:NAD(P)H-hydrate epimerase [Timonella sp. A28]|uniref:NAD(P)H-hydrate epimerase n=1 Tax=Timonella sp. A28 TaxID=3442640 RepID=UPI003EBA869C